MPAADNFAAFSQILAAYSTLDFTRSSLAGKGTWHLLSTTSVLLLCCLLLQNILTGLIDGSVTTTFSIELPNLEFFCH